jgi:glycosyltransferase involved in cell wall biosynthesis
LWSPRRRISRVPPCCRTPGSKASSRWCPTEWISPASNRHRRAAEIRQRYGKRLIFALGRHVYYKGFEYLIETMARIPDARLLLGSEGPLTPALRARAAALGLADHVVFLGRVPDDQLADHYFACDVFYLPSVEPSEAFSLGHVEAMARGRPVVCCELGNGVSYVNRHGETGLIVPPRDPAALAAALRELLDDPSRRDRLGRNAAQRVRSEFTLSAQCDAMRRNAVRVRPHNQGCCLVPFSLRLTSAFFLGSGRGSPCAPRLLGDPPIAAGMP